MLRAFAGTQPARVCDTRCTFPCEARSTLPPERTLDTPTPPERSAQNPCLDALQQASSSKSIVASKI
eukprot:2055166-Amphidinium_carterae.3